MANLSWSVLVFGRVMSSTPIYRFSASLWLYPGKAAWTFVTLDAAVATDIRDLFSYAARGFGSLPVEVTLGGSVWKTSIFPDSKSGSYVLPIKKAVRTAEGVLEGDVVDVAIRVLVD